MKKNAIIAAIVLSLLIAFRDDIGYFLKNKIILKGHVSPKIYEKIDFDYMSNMQIENFKKGIAVYDGSVLRYIDENANREFSLNIESSNYQMKTSRNRIFILDRTKRKIHIIKSSAEQSEVSLVDSKSPLFIKTSADNLMLNYKNADNPQIEGFAIMDEDGSVLRDYTFAMETITLMKSDDINGGYILSSVKLGPSSLHSNIVIYDKKGEIRLVDSIEKRVISEIIPFDSGYYLIEDDYIEVRDREFNTIKSQRLNYKIEDIELLSGELYLINDRNYMIVLDRDLKEKSRRKNLNRVVQIVKSGDNMGVLTKNSLSFKKSGLEFVDDARKAIDIGNGRMAIIFRGNIKFVDLY